MNVLWAMCAGKRGGGGGEGGGESWFNAKVLHVCRMPTEIGINWMVFADICMECLGSKEARHF